MTTCDDTGYLTETYAREIGSMRAAGLIHDCDGGPAEGTYGAECRGDRTHDDLRLRRRVAGMRRTTRGASWAVCF